MELNEASIMYKIIHGSADSNAKKINFDLLNKVSQRITKNCFDLNIDYQQEDKKVSQSHAGAKPWNSIPMNIRNSNTIATFKNHMYQHLLESQ